MRVRPAGLERRHPVGTPVLLAPQQVVAVVAGLGLDRRGLEPEIEGVLVLAAGRPLHHLPLLADEAERVDGARVVARLDLLDVTVDRLARGRTRDLQHAGRTHGGATLVTDLFGHRDDDHWLQGVGGLHLAAEAPHVGVLVEEVAEVLGDLIREVLPPVAAERVVQLEVALELAGAELLPVVGDDLLHRLAVDPVADRSPAALAVLVVEVGQGVAEQLGVRVAPARPLHHDLGTLEGRGALLPVRR